MVAHSDLTSRKRLYNIVPGTQPPRRATRWRHHKGEDREDDQAFDKEDAGLAEKGEGKDTPTPGFPESIYTPNKKDTPTNTQVLLKWVCFLI